MPSEPVGSPVLLTISGEICLLDWVRRVAAVPTVIVTAIGAILTIVKFAQGAAHEIPPILFASGIAATVILCAGGAIILFAEAAKKHASADYVFTVINLFGAAGYVLILLETQSLSTIAAGEYKGDPSVTTVFGSFGWLSVLLPVLIVTVAYIKQRKEDTWAPRGKKVCPDCREYPKAAARVCRYCGNEFGSQQPSELPAPESAVAGALVNDRGVSSGVG